MMKSLLLLVAVALILVLSLPTKLHEVHQVTLSSGQAGVFQILTAQSLPFLSLLNDNVTIYIPGDITEDVVLCANKFYGLPPVGNYNPSTCNVYLEFQGSHVMTSTNTPTQPHTTTDTGSHSDTGMPTTTTETPTVTTDTHTSTEAPTTDTHTTTDTYTTTEAPTTDTHTTTTEAQTTTTDTHTTTTEAPTTTTDTQTTTTEAQTTTTDTQTTTTDTQTTTTDTQTTTTDTQTTTTDTQTTTTDTQTSTTSTGTDTSTTAAASSFKRRYVNYRVGDQVRIVTLKSDFYNVGIYFKNAPPKDKITFTVAFNSSYCPNRFTGVMCELPITPMSGVTNTTLNMTSTYFSFDVPSSTAAKATQNFTVNFASSSFVNIWASSYGVPTKASFEYMG
jgi:hypothetical protein